MRILGLLAGCALALAACAGHDKNQPFTVSDVSVTADLPAVTSRAAVSYWAHLSDDLKTAIANEYVGRIDPKGKKIVVDVDEISLASPFAAGATAETARLSGRVDLLNVDTTKAASYDVTATASDVAAYLPPGTNIVKVSPTSEEYYRAVVQAFASGTKTTLDAAAGGS
ncbi:MAG: hypothetical protein U1E40_16495 [Amaricoccus sp.]